MGNTSAIVLLFIAVGALLLTYPNIDDPITQQQVEKLSEQLGDTEQHIGCLKLIKYITLLSKTQKRKYRDFCMSIRSKDNL